MVNFSINVNTETHEGMLKMYSKTQFELTVLFKGSSIHLTIMGTASLVAAGSRFCLFLARNVTKHTNANMKHIAIKIHIIKIITV